MSEKWLSSKVLFCRRVHPCFNFSGRDLPAIEACRIGINTNNATATKADNIEWTGYRKVESKLRSEVNTKNAKQHRLVRGWTGYRKVESKEDTSNNYLLL